MDRSNLFAAARQQVTGEEAPKESAPVLPRHHSTPTAEVPDDLEELVAWLAQQTWSDFAQSLVARYPQYGLSEKQIESARSMRVKCEARNTKSTTADPNAEVADLIEWLREHQGNDFAKSLVSQAAYRKLTPRQIEAAQRMKRDHEEEVARAEAIRKEREEREAALANLPDVPDGYYGIDTVDPDAVNSVAFYRILRDEDSGALSVIQVIGGNHSHPIPWAQVPSVFERIVQAGVREAAERYGRETEHCPRCGDLLTNEVSVARGIGPWCAKVWGWV